MAERRAIEVCADWAPLDGPATVGTLYATPARGRDVFSFEYARSWLDDMNPIARGAGLTLNISETDNAHDLDLARDVSARFRVSPAKTTAIIDEVRAAVRTWKDVAADAGLTRPQRDRMAPAFCVAD